MHLTAIMIIVPEYTALAMHACMYMDVGKDHVYI